LLESLKVLKKQVGTLGNALVIVLRVLYMARLVLMWH